MTRPRETKAVEPHGVRREPKVRKLKIGDFVKHRKNEHLVFRVLEVSEPPGELCRCLSLQDDSTTYMYHFDDLYRVDPEEAGVYTPAVHEPISTSVVERYRDATYELQTIVPFGGKPTRNVYVLRQSQVQDFLSHCGDCGEFVIAVKGIALPPID